MQEEQSPPAFLPSLAEMIRDHSAFLTTTFTFAVTS
jgi:hypothetical protein